MWRRGRRELARFTARWWAAARARRRSGAAHVGRERSEAPLAERIYLADSRSAPKVAPRDPWSEATWPHVARVRGRSGAFASRGSGLLIEDVGERPYRVDRMLTSLDGGGPPRPGHQPSWWAISLNCARTGPATVAQVLRERLGTLGSRAGGIPRRSRNQE